MTVNDDGVVVIDFIFITMKVSRPETRAARHSKEFRRTTLIVSHGDFASDFFHAIAGDISAAIERDIADERGAMGPYLIQVRGSVVVELSAPFSEFTISRAIVERDYMIVRTAEFVAVFATAEEPETGASRIPEPLKEFLIVRKVERTSWREILSIIGES